MQLWIKASALTLSKLKHKVRNILQPDSLSNLSLHTKISKWTVRDTSLFDINGANDMELFLVKKISNNVSNGSNRA